MAKCYAEEVTELDLSYNNLKDLSSLALLKKLQTLVLDHNQLTSQTKLPILPELHTLWVNHNRISNLTIFVDHLAVVCPKLRHLSMLYNDACPNYFNNGTLKQYSDYRLFVICRLKELKILDDQPVTDEERKESLAAYAAYKTSSVLDPGRLTATTVPRVTYKRKKTSKSLPQSDSLGVPKSIGSSRTPSPAIFDASSPSDGLFELDAEHIAAQQHRLMKTNGEGAESSDWSSDEDSVVFDRVRSPSSLFNVSNNNTDSTPAKKDVQKVMRHRTLSQVSI